MKEGETLLRSERAGNVSTGPKMMMKKYLLYDKLKVAIYTGRR
jgi:hypothetical protein